MKWSYIFLTSFQKLNPFRNRNNNNIRLNWTNSRTRNIFPFWNPFHLCLLLFFRYLHHLHRGEEFKGSDKTFLSFFFFFLHPPFLNGFKRRTIFWFFTARWNSRFPVIEPRLSPLYRKHPASIDTSPIIALGLTENINGHCTLPAAMLLIVPLKNFCRVSFSVARCYYAVFQ